MRVVSCLFTEHNLWLVVLAAIVCVSGGGIAFSLFERARERTGQQRQGWAFLAAVAMGSSVWCTHFIAMLAYEVKAPVVFDPILTMVSLVIVIAGCGLAVSLAANGLLRADICGVIVGLSIAMMHYTGMAAYHVAGVVEWHGVYIAASVFIAAMAACVALDEAVSKRWPHSELIAPGLFVVAVVGLHFTGMAAVQVTPDGSGADIKSEAFAALAVAVAGVGLVIVGTGITSYMIDTRVSMDAHARLQAFIKDAPAAMAMFDNDMRYIAHTDRWLQDYNLPNESLVGRSHYDVFPEVPEHWRQGHQRILRGAVESCNEEKFVRDDGVEHFIRWDVRPWFAGDGKIGGMMMLTEEISERKRTELKLWRLAKLDTLTSLPNRLHFGEHIEAELERAKTHGTKLAVIGIDLDGFKEINDHRGHKAGDHALKSLGERLNALVKEGEFVARLGGDEFAAVKRYDTLFELHEFVARLEAALAERSFYEGIALVTGGSMGIALYPDDGDTVTRLVSNADLAMYRAKANRERSTCFYDKSMDEAARERTFIAQELRHALERGQFELYYQVQNSVLTDDITGYEVLIRWRHPERGMISPVDFIPIAEETGDIIEIGEWVLRTACKQASGWNNKGKIAVNVSAVQLSNGDLAQTVRSILVETGLSPSRLELEITETAIIADKARTLHLMRLIKAMGVTIAIDDFGAGYSSLDTLRNFPFDKIKLDKSFTQELESDRQSKAIVRAVVAMARSLDIRVLAEGVETLEQLTILRSEGCDEAQGYLLGKPKPAVETFEDLRDEPIRMLEAG